MTKRTFQGEPVTTDLIGMRFQADDAIYQIIKIDESNNPVRAFILSPDHKKRGDDHWFHTDHARAELISEGDWEHECEPEFQSWCETETKSAASSILVGLKLPISADRMVSIVDLKQAIKLADAVGKDSFQISLSGPNFLTLDL